MSPVKHLIRVAKPIVQRFPKLAMTYRYVRDGWHANDEPRETPMGFKFAGDHAMQSGQFEPKESQLVKVIASNVDTVINIGANIGYYCCIALSQGKHVVAVEPINFNVRRLLRNIKANNWESRVEVYPVALSNRTGVTEIYGGGAVASLVKGWADTPEYYVTLVPTSTLDIIAGSRFQGKRCFVLVDMEGAEKLMLEGATSMMGMEPKPIWMMEVSISKQQPKGIAVNPNLDSTFQLFWNRGYEAWTADQECRIVSPAEIEEIAKGGMNTLPTHNFLFIQKGRRNELLDSGQQPGGAGKRTG